MESQVQIDFRNCVRTAEYRQRIGELILDLESH